MTAPEYNIHSTLVPARFPGQQTRQRVTVSTTTHTASVTNLTTKYGGQQWTTKCLALGCSFTETASTQDAARQAGSQHEANAN